jgi:hypothetical protein
MFVSNVGHLACAPLRLGFQPYPQTLDYTRKKLPGVNTLAYFGTEGKKVYWG